MVSGSAEMTLRAMFLAVTLPYLLVTAIEQHPQIMQHARAAVHTIAALIG